jgi:omega-6 fatty acid desaturase (delta-12 desaturase)
MLYFAYIALPISYWLTLAAAFTAGGFMVRVFIIQHDCGHYSFFKSPRVNDVTGWLMSLITLVPYLYWRKQHALHHVTTGNLDRRGHGYMTLYTIDEYKALSSLSRLQYRLYRNPFIFVLLGPIFLKLINDRTTRDKELPSEAEKLNVHITNLLIAALVAAGGIWIGFGSLFLILAPTYWFASAAGIWLFFVQHHFDPAYWKRNESWSLNEAALEGSTYLKLPKVLQWFTGNIGFHHIHHLKINVPNYRLQQAFEASPEYQKVHTLTLRSSLKTMFLSLWDEDHGRLISFREVGS